MYITLIFSTLIITYSIVHTCNDNIRAIISNYMRKEFNNRVYFIGFSVVI